MALRFRQIQHGQPRRRHAIGAGIEQARRPDRGLGFAAGQIARPALMADGGDLAILRRADADALDRRRPVRRVVEHQRPRQRHLHGPSGRARAQRREQRIGADKQLAAEAAADVRRDERTFSLGMPSVFAISPDAPIDHLVGGPQRELVAVPRGDRCVRLHHRVRLIGRRVGRIELNRRRGERAGEVADGSIRRARR